VGGGLADEIADGADIGIGIGGVGDLAAADYVIANDDGADPGKLERGVEVGWVARFIGVDEDEIEGREVAPVKVCEGVESWAFEELDFIREAGAGDVRAGYAGVEGVELEGNEFATGGEGAGEVDGAIAA